MTGEKYMYVQSDESIEYFVIIETSHFKIHLKAP